MGSGSDFLFFQFSTPNCVSILLVLSVYFWPDPTISTYIEFFVFLLIRYFLSYTVPLLERGSIDSLGYVVLASSLLCFAMKFLGISIYMCACMYTYIYIYIYIYIYMYIHTYIQIEKRVKNKRNTNIFIYI
jgi:hypothetical protein